MSYTDYQVATVVIETTQLVLSQFNKQPCCCRKSVRCFLSDSS